jgi:hypothetical protein
LKKSDPRKQTLLASTRTRYTSMGRSGGNKIGLYLDLWFVCGRSRRECISIKVHGTRNEKMFMTRPVCRPLFCLRHWNPTPVSRDIRTRKVRKKRTSLRVQDPSRLSGCAAQSGGHAKGIHNPNGKNTHTDVTKSNQHTQQPFMGKEFKIKVS